MGMFTRFSKQVVGRLRIMKRRGGWRSAKIAAGVHTVQAVENAHNFVLTHVQDDSAKETCVEEVEVVEPLERCDSMVESSITMRIEATAEEAFSSFIYDLENDLTSAQQQARSRIQQAYALSRPDNIRQLISQSLIDIDDLIFRSELVSGVAVVWKPLPPDCHGETRCIGFRVRGEKAKIWIELAESLVPWAGQDPGIVWGVLIHELLHVFELVMAPRMEMCLCGNRVAHGQCFRAASEAVVKVMGIEALTFEHVADYDDDCCHSRHDEYVLQGVKEAREEAGRCTLSDDVQDSMLSWWAGERWM